MRERRFRLFAFALPVALCCAVSPIARAEPFANLDARLAFDNNVTDAKETGDIENDTALSLAGAYGSSLELGDWGSIEAAAQGRFAQYARFSGLNEIDLGARVAWREKLGLGPYTPVVSVTLEANHGS